MLSRKLQPQHPNIVHVFNVKKTSSTYYVIMEDCLFPLNRIPADFKEFLYDSGTQSNRLSRAGTLHTVAQSTGGVDTDSDSDSPLLLGPPPSTRGLAESGGGAAGRRRISTRYSSIGPIVLNALVQDLVRGMGFLHSKNVVHCDMKVGSLTITYSSLNECCWPRNVMLQFPAQLSIILLFICYCTHCDAFASAFFPPARACSPPMC